MAEKLEVILQDTTQGVLDRHPRAIFIFHLAPEQLIRGLDRVGGMVLDHGDIVALPHDPEALVVSALHSRTVRIERDLLVEVDVVREDEDLLDLPPRPATLEDALDRKSGV